MQLRQKPLDEPWYWNLLILLNYRNKPIMQIWQYPIIPLSISAFMQQLAGRQMRTNNHRWLEQTLALPEGSYSPKAVLCATALWHQTESMHHYNTALAHVSTCWLNSIARLARWQSCPHTGRPGRNMIWKRCRLGLRAWLLACHGIYSAGVMSVWLIGTTIGAHVLRAVYSTHRVAGTPGLEAPWASTQIKGLH